MDDKELIQSLFSCSNKKGNRCSTCPRLDKESFNTCSRNIMRLAAERLASYAVTGLTPEEVGELISPETVETVRLLSTMADEGSMQHMLELFQAEAQGRLIALPIPFGAKKEAYAIANDDLDDEVPKEIVTLDCEEIENLSIWPSGELVVTVDGWEIGNSDIGKTVFLTRAEAEAALKGGNA